MVVVIGKAVASTFVMRSDFDGLPSRPTEECNRLSKSTGTSNENGFCTRWHIQSSAGSFQFHLTK